MADDLSSKFVVLRHDLVRDDPAPDHYDLMILDPERAGSGTPLETWRLDSWGFPLHSRGIRVQPHREEWLHQQGELTGQRGYVTRVEGGDCRLIRKTGTCWRIRFSISVSGPAAGNGPGGEAELELISQSADGVVWSAVIRRVEAPDSRGNLQD